MIPCGGPSKLSVAAKKAMCSKTSCGTLERTDMVTDVRTSRRGRKREKGNGRDYAMSVGLNTAFNYV